MGAGAAGGGDTPQLSPLAVAVVILSGSFSAVDAQGRAARFVAPAGVALDGARNIAYVVDAYANALRKVDLASGQVSTLAGAGYSTFLPGPLSASSKGGLMATAGVAFANGVLYVAMPTLVAKITPLP